MDVCPWLSSVPILVPTRSIRFTIPKYVNVVSVLTTFGMISAQLVTIVPREFGKMCLNISRLSDAPSVRAAYTNS